MKMVIKVSDTKGMRLSHKTKQIFKLLSGFMRSYFKFNILLYNGSRLWAEKEYFLFSGTTEY
jgi:hypothetical protein